MSPTGRKRCQRAQQPDLFESCVSDVWNQTTSKETHWWHWCEQQSKSQQVAAMNESVILHHWNVAKTSSFPTHIRCIRTGDEWNKSIRRCFHTEHERSLSGLSSKQQMREYLLRESSSQACRCWSCFDVACWFSLEFVTHHRYEYVWSFISQHHSEHPLKAYFKVKG